MIVNAGRLSYSKPDRYDYDAGNSPRYTPDYDVRKPNDRERRIQRLVALAQMNYVGPPMIYYGNETGLEGDYAEDGRRTIPWDSLDYELLDYFKRLIGFRRESKALRLGEVEAVVIDDAQRVYVFKRQYEDEVIYCGFNSSDETAEVMLPMIEGEWHEILGRGNLIETRAGIGYRIGPCQGGAA